MHILTSTRISICIRVYYAVYIILCVMKIVFVVVGLLCRRDTTRAVSVSISRWWRCVSLRILNIIIITIRRHARVQSLSEISIEDHVLARKVNNAYIIVPMLYITHIYSATQSRAEHKGRLLQLQHRSRTSYTVYCLYIYVIYVYTRRVYKRESELINYSTRERLTIIAKLAIPRSTTTTRKVPAAALSCGPMSLYNMK